jgi:hypothetical protein
MKKFNNYNNGVKYADMVVLQSFDLDTSMKVPPPKFMVSFFSLGNFCFSKDPNPKTWLLNPVTAQEAELLFTHLSTKRIKNLRQPFLFFQIKYSLEKHKCNL